MFWPENTMTWPWSRISAPQNPPPHTLATSGRRIWAILPENTMTWPELRTWAARTAPTRGGHIMGIGGKSGNSMSPGRASEIWPFILNKSCTTVHAIFDQPPFAQKETTIKTFPRLLFLLGAQTCMWLASLWVTLRTTRGAGRG